MSDDTSTPVPETDSPVDPNTIPATPPMPDTPPEDPTAEIVRTSATIDGNDFATHTEVDAAIATALAPDKVNRPAPPTDPNLLFVTRADMQAAIAAIPAPTALPPQAGNVGITGPTPEQQAAWAASEAQYKWTTIFQQLFAALIVKGESATSEKTLATAALATDKYVAYLAAKYPSVPVPA